MPLGIEPKAAESGGDGRGVRMSPFGVRAVSTGRMVQRQRMERDEWGVTSTRDGEDLGKMEGRGEGCINSSSRNWTQSTSSVQQKLAFFAELNSFFSSSELYFWVHSRLKWPEFRTCRNWVPHPWTELGSVRLNHSSLRPIISRNICLHICPHIFHHISVHPLNMAENSLSWDSCLTWSPYFCV